MTTPNDGGWLYEDEPTHCHPFYLRPTHWMPLPPPPKQEAPE